jgi:Esterase-like activity of phytase
MTAELHIRAEYRLPLAELSGLALGPGRELLAVGDDKSGLAVVQLPEVPGKWPEARRVVLGPVLRAAGAGRKYRTNWEAVAVDRAGRVGILSEHGGLVVLESALERVERVVRLELGRPGRHGLRAPRSNSGGEGLALLPGDHVLVALEKHPPLLLELGPEGDEPLGVSPDTLSDGILPVTGRLVVLAVWTVDLPTGAGDISDLAVTEDGRLYLVSAQGRLVARLRLPLTADAPAATQEVWRLPPAIGTAEGLVVLEPSLMLIASDRRSKTGSVYEVS